MPCNWPLDVDADDEALTDAAAAAAVACGDVRTTDVVVAIGLAGSLDKSMDAFCFDAGGSVGGRFR